MGLKRPSEEIPTADLERAITLKLEGKSWRAVASEVGWGKSALHERLREDPRLAGARGTTADEADDGDLADRLRTTFDRTLVVLDSAVEQVAKRVVADSATVADANGLAGVAERVLKLAFQLERRTSPAGAAGMHLNVGVAVHTSGESTALQALRSRRAAAVFEAPTTAPTPR